MRRPKIRTSPEEIKERDEKFESDSKISKKKVGKLKNSYSETELNICWNCDHLVHPNHDFVMFETCSKLQSLLELPIHLQGHLF